MCYLLPLPRAFRLIVLNCLFLLFLILPVAAQDEQPAPQFLYRNENHLILVNGYTGEATELPFDVTERDRFTWSPDGKYLLSQLRDGETYRYCLNLYDVDKQDWLYPEPISCSVEEAIFSVDGTTIVYSTNDETNGVLWLYNLEAETSQELYRTTDGDNLYPSGITGFRWSPTSRFLTFISYTAIMGGTLNGLVVMNVETQTYIMVNASDTYYASYNPIWAEGDGWFLIVLKEEYTTSSSAPYTNHEGDVYLVNSETGEQYRLTYTPALLERDIRWTEDGRITFTIEQELIYTLEEAMNVEEVPYNAITMPEPYEPEIFCYGLNGLTVSPDPKLSAWIAESQGEDGNPVYTLNFGTAKTGKANFSVLLEDYDNYQYSNVIIGWRPSDYSYPLP